MKKEFFFPNKHEQINILWEKKKENYLVFNHFRTALVFNFNLAMSVLNILEKIQYCLWLVYFKWRNQDRVYAKLQKSDKLMLS